MASWGDAKAMPTPRSEVAAFLGRSRWRTGEILVWLALLAAFFLFPDRLVLGSRILIAALFALSLDLLLGYAGMISLGHAAYFGLGAYAAGLVSVHGWTEPITGLAFATLLSAAFGYLTGFILVRLQGVALLMVTLGLGLLVAEIANAFGNITGGSDGLSGFEFSPLFGIFHFDIAGRTAYLYSLAATFLGFVLVRRIVHSPFGLSLQGYRENPARMAQIGAPMVARLRFVNMIAAGLAGLAGAMLTQTNQFVGLDAVSFERSAEILIILILGGRGKLYGGLAGAIVFTAGRDVFSEANPQYWYLWLGLLLVLIVLFVPDGLVGGTERLAQWMRRRGGAIAR